MDKPPAAIKGASILCYSFIDQRHRPTGACAHRVDGELVGAASGLAVCRYGEDAGVILYYCDERWQVMTHAHHQTLDEAKDQAEFEYEGVSATWETVGR
jgi:hypothetical protein